MEVPYISIQAPEDYECKTLGAWSSSIKITFDGTVITNTDTFYSVILDNGNDQIELPPLCKVDLRDPNLKIIGTPNVYK